MTGLDDFKRLLEEFQNLSVWAAGGSIVLPFVASFLSIIPPWPAGLNVMTSVLQLTALILVYQRYSGRSRSIITRNITILFFALPVILISYMIIFSVFTIYVPQASRSVVIGYQCVGSAKAVYGELCPLLGLDALAAVAYDEFVLWTRPSIAAVRVMLVSLWFMFFICLASLIGKFLVYQMNRPVPRPRHKDSESGV